ncbi:MAG: hypothetical protein JWO46_1837, partial [Nocardioidaceae bacterium]|nr:hypothetical protein [Nocardioidaceae bacterium]
FYFGAVWLYLGHYTASATSGGGDQMYQAAIAVRVLGELYLVALVIRDVLEPDKDVVRSRRTLDDEPMLAEPAVS